LRKLCRFVFGIKREIHEMNDSRVDNSIGKGGEEGDLTNWYKW